MGQHNLRRIKEGKNGNLLVFKPHLDSTDSGKRNIAYMKDRESKGETGRPGVNPSGICALVLASNTGEVT